MIIGFLTSRMGISDKQEREIRKIFDISEFDTVVHGGSIGDERIDFLAYKAGLDRRIYSPGSLTCGLFVRKGDRRVIQARPDPSRLLYVIGDADLVIACPKNGTNGRATEWALERNKNVIVISQRGWCEEYNGGVEGLLRGRD